MLRHRLVSSPTWEIVARMPGFQTKPLISAGARLGPDLSGMTLTVHSCCCVSVGNTLGSKLRTQSFSVLIARCIIVSAKCDLVTHTLNIVYLLLTLQQK